jgi:mRNA-degrading endonuclease RelE of RelBE toxin-antitoxin system
MFRVRLSPKAKRQLKNLSKQDKISIGEIIEDIKDNPLVGKALGRELTKKYSYKIGVYRVIYKINDKDQIIYVLKAEDRGKVYN